jgi:ligand-binding sensor protein
MMPKSRFQGFRAESQAGFSMTDQSRQDNTMKLTDILPLDQWVEFEKDIHERSGLDTNVFDTEGYRITDYKQWINRFCPTVKADDRGQSFICAVAHMNIAEMARQAGESVVEECDAGLLKLVVPIFANGDFIGAVGACGLLLEDGEVDSFMVNKTLDWPEEEIEALAHDIPRMTQSDVENLAGYIRERLDQILKDAGKF